MSIPYSYQTNFQNSMTHLQNFLLAAGYRLQPKTLNTLFKLVDVDRSGILNQNELDLISQFIKMWSTTFQRYDFNKNGFIETKNMKSITHDLGYNLSDSVLSSLVKHFCYQLTHMSYDEYIVWNCVMHSGYSNFQKMDTNQVGHAILCFDDLLYLLHDSGI